MVFKFLATAVVAGGLYREAAKAQSRRSLAGKCNRNDCMQRVSLSLLVLSCGRVERTHLRHMHAWASSREIDLHADLRLDVCTQISALDTIGALQRQLYAYMRHIYGCSLRTSAQ